MKKNQSLRILLCGGGTGGHIYPAIAIADELKKNLYEYDKYSLIEFLFIGDKNGIEMQIIPKRNYPILGLWISGIPRNISKNLFLFPIKIYSSYKKCLKILNSFSPNLVIGTGGYVSGIPLYLAYKKKIPIFIQEQNVVPGYTNKIIGKNYANKIFLGHEQSVSFFPKEKIILSGNPIRSEILLPLVNRKEGCKKFKLDHKKPIILSIGGSLGARSINNVWIKGIKKIIEANIQLIWQVGKLDFDNIQNKSSCQNPNISINKFLDNIHIAYSIADIIVSRAGGIAISEIAIYGKPSILIPLSSSSGDHQNANAKAIIANNAALLINNEEIEDKLIDAVIFLLGNKKLKASLSKNILAISKSNATKIISKEIINFLN